MQNDLDPKGLLPCPFCEGNAHLEPELYSDENPNEVIGPASVNCQNCGAAIWGDWSDDAIAAWNRRHLSATVPAGDGELVERVARAIAQADEQSGGPPYEYRISLSKHAKEQLFDEARAAIKAVLEAMTAEDSARQNGKEPVVKRLEWIDMGDGPRCITVCGAYAIYPSTSRGRPTLSLSGMPKGLFGKFASIEEAKAAAQAHYDARIRSALKENAL